MEIRKMEARDFNKVFAMMQVFYASDALLIHPADGVLRRTLADCVGENPYVEGFVFDQAGTLAGYGMVAKSYSTEAGGPCIWLEDIYIRPEFRGNGFGMAYLTFVEKYYKGSAVRIRLEAEPENAHAMHVYLKAGYEVLGYTQLVREMNKE